MIGETLGHYRILDLLGAGGMGEVYRAEDTTLGREVALKVLPAELSSDPERLARFEREAKTLAALDHPNIVTIHSVEEADGFRFLTMQLVEGKPLSELIPTDGMPLDRIFDIAIPLADALATAHERGVIHRDLKPANIMVTNEGRVKVLDFGLAKLRQEVQAPLATELPTEALTEEGRIIGTMPYMSPEQLEGKEIDSRSDIFSLGVVLYELAAGERPFQGDTSVLLISSIFKDTPQSVDTLRGELPHHLGRVIAHCLEKSPKRRYQTAIDVHNELDALKKEIESDVVARASSVSVPAMAPPKRFGWRLAAAGVVAVLLALGVLWLGRREPTVEEVAQHAATAAEEPMIAVLPFENLGLPEDEFFADGMTEEITSRLAMVSGLGVISRTSAMQYKENRPSLKQIGQELGVDYVLEGTVRWAKSPDGPGRVRITPQLIRVADDRHLWADNLERELEDIFAVQAEIAQQVIAGLGVTLLATERTALEDRPTESIPAYQAFLKGLEALARQEHKEAARLFELAIEEAPGFVEARARLVVAYAQLYAWGDYSEDWSVKSAAALESTQALASDNPDVQLATAACEYHIQQDFSGALAIVNKLAEKHPNHIESLKYVGYISRRLGRWEESNAAFKKALRLDPRDGGTIASLAHNYRNLQRFEEAEALFDRCIAIAPDYSGCFRNKAWNKLFWTGDTAATRQIAEEGPDHFWNDFLLTRLDYLDRDYAAVLARLDDLGQSGSGEWFGQRIRASIPYAMGDIERARSAARELLPTFEQLIDEQPGNFVDMSVLATLYSVLGETELALATGEHAIDIAQYDLFEGPFTWFMLAETCLIVGEHERAIELVDQVLATPGWDRPSHHWYRLDPLWDPVRNNPRFQALLEKYGQEAG